MVELFLPVKGEMDSIVYGKKKGRVPTKETRPDESQTTKQF